MKKAVKPYILIFFLFFLLIGFTNCGTTRRSKMLVEKGICLDYLKPMTYSKFKAIKEQKRMKIREKVNKARAKKRKRDKWHE